MSSGRSDGRESIRDLDSQLAAYSAAAGAALDLAAGRAKSPNRSIAVYSAAAAGAGVLGALDVDAAIYHQAVDWPLSSGNPMRTINFDGDATSDALLTWNSGDRMRVGYAVGTNGGEAVGGGYNAVRFTTGQTISNAAGTWGPARRIFVVTTTGGNFTAGNFDDTHTGYLGFRFNSGGIKYAWAHIDSIAADGTSYHVDGYAYQDNGDPIKAGQETDPVPEPSTIALALLASGAAGVMASRRRRILKGRGACGRRTAAQ